MRGHRDELHARRVVGSLVRILVACEFSGTVRDAFLKRGHYAVSCDLLPSDNGGPHFQGDVLDILGWGWDLMVAHPPCTHLAVSGAAHFHRKVREQAEALDFVRKLMDAPIPRWCIENPVSVISTKIRKPTQIVHPWQFGHSEMKTTCLWLHNLKSLVPTNVVDKGINKLHRLPPTPDRWKLRSKTFQGIADAMAEQWGEL